MKEMSSEVKRKIIDYMEKTRFCSLATVGRRSKEPRAAIIYYENSGLDIYFNTGKATQKALNIMANPAVAITIHHDNPSAKEISDTRGILYIGRANVVEEKDFNKVPDGVLKLYDMVNSFYPGASIIFKVTPKKIHFIDYSKGFGHRDVLEVDDL